MTVMYRKEKSLFVLLRLPVTEITTEMQFQLLFSTEDRNVSHLLGFWLSYENQNSELLSHRKLFHLTSTQGAS